MYSRFLPPLLCVLFFSTRPEFTRAGDPPPPKDHDHVHAKIELSRPDPAVDPDAEGHLHLKEHGGRSAIHIHVRHLEPGATYAVQFAKGGTTDAAGEITIPVHEEKPHPVGTKKPNGWGIYDLHGNVAEWTLDQYDPKRYASLQGQKSLINPVLLPGEKRYPHVVRGVSFEDDAAGVRSAARRASKPEWSRRDPQQPQSIWWHTDAIFVGFRLVRAVEEPEALKGFQSKITRESPDM